MSLVKGMTFKMTKAAKTAEKEHFRHRCRAQGIPLYFSRIDYKWSLIFGEGQKSARDTRARTKFERHVTQGDCVNLLALLSLALRTFAPNFPNIDFFVEILPLKDDELVSDVRNVKKMGGHRLRFGENLPGRTPKICKIWLL